MKKTLNDFLNHKAVAREIYMIQTLLEHMQDHPAKDKTLLITAHLKIIKKEYAIARKKLKEAENESNNQTK